MTDRSRGPVLVTGAGGFIGRRLTHSLLDDGWLVRAFVRPSHDAAPLEAAGAEIVRGDAMDPDALARSASGCEGIFHLATARGPKGLSYRQLQERNVRLAETVVHAAAVNGVRRTVYAGAAGIVDRLGPMPAGEEAPIRPNNPYRASRARAETVLHERAAAQSVDVVIGRIALRVLGPGAKDWTRTFRSVRDGRIRVLPPGGTLHSADVDDVVAGLRLCLTTPDVGGQTFMLAAARPMPIIDMYRAIAQDLGVAFEPRIVSPAPFRAYAALGDAFFRLTHRQLPHHYTAGFLATAFAIDIGRARTRLGYDPRYTLRKSIARTATWLREEGRI